MIVNVIRFYEVFRFYPAQFTTMSYQKVKVGIHECNRVDLVIKLYLSDNLSFLVPNLD